MKQIKTPEHLVSLFQELPLNSKEKQDLTKDLANITRRFFRNQIRQQKDIHHVPFAPRRRKKLRVKLNNGKAYFQTRAKADRLFANLGKKMRTTSSSSGFESGWSGKYGAVGKLHNEGATIPYKTRMGGWFDEKSQRWRGGTEKTGFYALPKREFIGWTPELEQVIAHKILSKMESLG